MSAPLKHSLLSNGGQTGKEKKAHASCNLLPPSPPLRFPPSRSTELRSQGQRLPAAGRAPRRASRRRHPWPRATFRRSSNSLGPRAAPAAAAGECLRLKYIYTELGSKGKKGKKLRPPLAPDSLGKAIEAKQKHPREK